jgi:hypothetical protein
VATQCRSEPVATQCRRARREPPATRRSRCTQRTTWNHWKGSDPWKGSGSDPHGRSRKSAMGPLSGCLSGSSTWSSRPPAFARLVARALNGFGSAPFLLEITHGPAGLCGQDPVRCHRFEHRVKDTQQLLRDGPDGSLPSGPLGDSLVTGAR